MKPLIATWVLTLLLSVESLAGDINDFNRQFRILPQPQKIELLKTKGLLYSDLRSVALINTNEKPVMSGILEALPLTHIPSAGTVSLIIQSNLSLPSPEGYVLEVNGKQIIIKAQQQAGLFYGIQTLKQLLEDSHDQQIGIPACRITDYPEIAFRAIHLDLKHGCRQVLL
jgi:hexosaminidase